HLVQYPKKVSKQIANHLILSYTVGCNILRWEQIPYFRSSNRLQAFSPTRNHINSLPKYPSPRLVSCIHIDQQNPCTSEKNMCCRNTVLPLPHFWEYCVRGIFVPW